MIYMCQVKYIYFSLFFICFHACLPIFLAIFFQKNSFVYNENDFTVSGNLPGAPARNPGSWVLMIDLDFTS